jgi:ribosomal protein L11 methyltransferase
MESPMTLTQVSTSLPQAEACALVDAASARDNFVLTASAHEDAGSGAWVFEATCAGEPDLAALAALARQTLGFAVTFAVKPLDPAINWVAKSLEGLAPVTAGGFYVYGSHEAAAPPAGLTAIRIDAAEAFGTGHHETTTGCLEAMEVVLKRRRPRRPLDVGTGTGVLAIALARRLRMPVIASDIDAVAVRTTADNAHNNGVGALIVPVAAAGLESPVIRGSGPYDLIVANILAGPLVHLAPAIGRAAKSGGTVILSGILNAQAARVIAAYRAAGLVLERKLVRGEWTTLLLEKRAGKIKSPAPGRGLQTSLHALEETDGTARGTQGRLRAAWSGHR